MESGTLPANYESLSPLGKGDMGEVSRGLDPPAMPFSDACGF